MQDYGFDRFESRVPWNQTKWDPDVLEEKFGSSDVLPAWIADMDFKTPPVVQAAVMEAARHGMYGYTGVGKDVIQSYLNWQSRRNGWQGREEWLRFTPGVVSAINLLLLSQTDPGDEVLIQRPVYYPFFHSIRQQERTVVNSPLVYRDGRYEIDFEDFARKADLPSAAPSSCAAPTIRWGGCSPPKSCAGWGRSVWKTACSSLPTRSTAT